MNERLVLSFVVVPLRTESGATYYVVKDDRSGEQISGLPRWTKQRATEIAEALNFLEQEI